MMKTLDLTRFSFLRPAIAAVLVVVGFVLDHFASLFLGMYRVEYGEEYMVVKLATFLIDGLTPLLIQVYLLACLWKVLHEQYAHRKSDPWFLVTMVAFVIHWSVSTCKNLFQIDMNDFSWGFALIYYLSLILLLISIGRMPENLFGMKWFYVSATILLILLHIVGIRLFYMIEDFLVKAEYITVFLLSRSGVSLLSNLFLFLIFYRAFKTPHSPGPDPTERLIDDFGKYLE